MRLPGPVSDDWCGFLPWAEFILAGLELLLADWVVILERKSPSLSTRSVRDDDQSIVQSALFRAPMVSGLSRVENSRDGRWFVGMSPTVVHGTNGPFQGPRCIGAKQCGKRSWCPLVCGYVSHKLIRTYFLVSATKNSTLRDKNRIDVSWIIFLFKWRDNFISVRVCVCVCVCLCVCSTGRHFYSTNMKGKVVVPDTRAVRYGPVRAVRAINECTPFVGKANEWCHFEDLTLKATMNLWACPAA
jgi:hypothetical protein